jgi:putative membrane protein
VIELLPIVAILVAVGTLYGLGIRRIWRRSSRRVIPPWRAVCFGLGLLVVAGALIGPLDAQADTRFSAHMVQHVLLVLAAAPLFALGTPISVLVLSLPPSVRRRTTTPALRSRAAEFVFSPLFILAAYVIVLWGSHLPAVYDAAVNNQALHDLEHLLYLFTAALFWSAIVGLDLGPARLSYPIRLLYLFLSMAAMEVLGLALSGTDHALYPHYVREAHAAGLSAVDDQHTGGVIMWLSGMLVAVPAMAAVVLAWMAEDERRTAHEQDRQFRVAAAGVEHADR